MHHRPAAGRLAGTLAIAAAAALALLLAACGGGGEPAAAEAAADAAAPSERIAAAAPAPDNPAWRLASAGHGGLFDAKNQPIKLDLATIGRLQDAIRADTRKAIGDALPKDTAALLAEADALRAQADFGEADKRMLQGAATWRLLQDAPAAWRDAYEWRLEELNARIFGPAKPGSFAFDPRLQDLLKRLRYIDWEARFPLFKSYAQRCADAGVPLPPDWAETGTAWVRQGPLSTNLLAPGEAAEVWTYSDPARRGVCIALPRGDGAPGSAAGIICQSATTGAACFWDNKLRSVAPEAFIGWRGRTLRIADLKDGSNLASSCTACHRGNNVFLISPDDRTWARLLRGPLLGPWTGTLTTRVESSTDNRGGHPRYVPITTAGGRTGWENPLPTTTTCSGCHEPPSPGIIVPPGFMPPSCTSLGGGCYGW